MTTKAISASPAPTRAPTRRSRCCAATISISAANPRSTSSGAGRRPSAAAGRRSRLGSRRARHRQTLRARWLAAQRARTAKPAPSGSLRRARRRRASRAGGAACLRPARIRRSAAPASELPRADIAVGLGERRVTTISAALAPAPRRRQPTPASVAAATRAKERRRARTAAARPAEAHSSAPPVQIATPLAPGRRPARPTRSASATTRPGWCRASTSARSDDLKLFAPDGTPHAEPAARDARDVGGRARRVEGQHGADRGGDRPRGAPQQASAALDRAEPELPAP